MDDACYNKTMSLRMHRRSFLKTTAALVAAMHQPMHLVASRIQGQYSPRLLHLKLQTHKLDELTNFYHRQFGLALVGNPADSSTFNCGRSQLQFTQATDKTEPFYHFAWNIPENQFAEAKAWLKQRTPLLVDNQTGKDEVHFASWNAHAVYFRDPAGNIGELIARHTLKNSSPTKFSVHSLECISEIGLVTPRARTLSADLAGKLSWNKTGSELSFVGDDRGYLIVAPVGRAWLPDRIQKAMVAPAEVKVNQQIKIPLRWDNEPFELTGGG